MTKQQRRSGFGDIEETVTDLSTSAIRKQSASLTDGRGRPGHAGTKGKDKAGLEKATFSLSIDRQTLIDEMATAEDVSKSAIVEAAVVAFYNAWQSGKVDLSGLKSPARSLRFAWNLNIPDKFDLFSSDLQP